ncbi:MAG: ComEC/Rec2 family competence protein [Bacteroidota bacterium]|nr:ComEC/Rec2 family competence protein [Candidatus Kapabacteria bacterium]MDW8220204.1 ComEC/Rec2 family competence protein [Bacteroidota bacterium]
MAERIIPRNVPAVRMVCLIAVGIALEYSWSVPLWILAACTGIALGGAVYSVTRNAQRRNGNRQEQHSVNHQHYSITVRWGIGAISSYISVCVCTGICIGKQAHVSVLGHLQQQFLLDAHHRRVLPAMPAVVRGEVVRCLRRDSRGAVILVEGMVDTQAFPRIEGVRAIVHVRATRVSTSAAMWVHPRDFLPGTTVYAVGRVWLPRAPLLAQDLDEEQYARALGASFIMVSDTRNTALLSSQTTLSTLLTHAADYLEQRIAALFSEQTAPFALALLTGNTVHIPPQTRAMYVRTGTIHVLVVSGLHVGIVVGIVMMLTSSVRSAGIRWGIVVMALVVFIGITGAAPSAERAGCMAALSLLAGVTERRTSLLNSIALSAILLLLLQPSLLYARGFHMSLAAVTGIAVTMPVFERGMLSIMGVKPWERSGYASIRRYVSQALAVSCAAASAVMPLAAWYFGVVSFVFALANLVVIPMSVAAMVYTCVAVACSWISESLAALFSTTAEWCIVCGITVNEYLARLEYAAFEGVQAYGIALFLSGALIYCFWRASRRVIAARVVIVAIAAIGMQATLRFSRSSPFVEIVPREQCVAVVVRPSSASHTIVLLQDRRVYENAELQRDRGLERFLLDECVTQGDTLTVCTTGMASMIIAAGIVQHVGEMQATQSFSVPAGMRIIASSIAYKSPRFFAALDTLRARKIPCGIAEHVLRRDSSIVLTEYSHSPVQVRWDVWQCSLQYKAMLRDTIILLPRVVQQIQIQQSSIRVL